MVKLLCHRCGWSWNYGGTKEYHAGCPQCGTTVQLKLGHARYLESIAESEPVETGEAA